MKKKDSSAPASPAKKANARGRRKIHAARLTTDVKVQLGHKVPSGKPARGAHVRERVLHAAVECFGAFGFEGTSTRAVAERAGVSHPLLLYHFESKDQLWLSTMEDVLNHYMEEMRERFAQVDANDPAALLRAFIENFVRYSARVPQLHRIMTQESTQGSDRIHHLVDRYLRPSFSDMCKIIRRGQVLGVVRKGDPGQLYYSVIGLGGTLLCVSTEFKLLTGRDVFSEIQIQKTIDLIFDFLFVQNGRAG